MIHERKVFIGDADPSTAKTEGNWILSGLISIGAHFKSRGRQDRRVIRHTRQMFQLNQLPSNSKPQKLSVPVSKQLCLIKRTQWACCGAVGRGLPSQTTGLIANHYRLPLTKRPLHNEILKIHRVARTWDSLLSHIEYFIQTCSTNKENLENFVFVFERWGDQYLIWANDLVFMVLLDRRRSGYINYRHFRIEFNIVAWQIFPPPPNFIEIENVRISYSNNFNHSFDGSIIEANCSAQLNFTLPTRYRITYLIISSTSLPRILVCSKTGPVVQTIDHCIHPLCQPPLLPSPSIAKIPQQTNLLLGQQLGRGGNDPRARAGSKAKEDTKSQERCKSRCSHSIYRLNGNYRPGTREKNRGTRVQL